jgi:agmatine deiminase
MAAYTDAKARLSTATDALGNKLVLHDCLEPDLDKLENISKGANCVASYVNFLAVNGGIIIPRFGDEDRDLQAFQLFETLFPDRKVVQVYIHALPHIGGGIHCATQQVPALA